MPDIFALVDCNNFYVSCERLFVPFLKNKPVVVLSNNDGCVIARSNEAKRLGIKMGVPVFEISRVIESNGVHVFSTNYALYGDISQRVMRVLARLVPHMEIYSIDEAFLDLSSVPVDDLTSYSRMLRDKINRYTGIPVTIGLGSSKTLAKVANQLAKTDSNYGGVLSLCHQHGIDSLLENIEVEQVWGVGEKYRQFFNRNGILTALDLREADPYHIRNHLGIPGQRLVMEMQGRPCYRLDDNPDIKKEICTSRSFGHPITGFAELEAATTSYASKVARKLRSQNSLARNLLVFVMTNKFASGPQYVNYELTELPEATNNSQTLIHYCSVLLKRLYKKGYRYKKSGVIVSELVPDQGLQRSLWTTGTNDKKKKIMQVMDELNANGGEDLVKFAIQGNDSSWKMRQHNLSPHYTTKWDDLLTVEMDSLSDTILIITANDSNNLV